MPLKPKLITTEADVLIDIIKHNKELPLAEVAKRLHMPVKTIEEWATFLEEEKIISIKYKLTTPYLVYIEPSSEKKKFKHKEEPSNLLEKRGVRAEEIDSRIDEIDKLLGKAKKYAKTGQFKLTKNSYSTVADELTFLNDTVASLSSKAGVKKQELENELTGVMHLLDKARQQVEAGHFDEANELYSQIHAQLHRLFITVKELYEEAKPAPIVGKKNVDELLEQAYSLMRSGNVEGAKRIYERLRHHYSGLSEDFLEKKRDVEKNLVKLNKDLSSAVDAAAKTKLQENSKKISVLMSTARSQMNKKDFEAAEKSYNRVKKVFEELPAGFQKQKNLLEKQIIELYEMLAFQRKKALTTQVSKRVKEINSGLQKIKKIMPQNIYAATKMYNELKEKYSALPAGFLKEKLTVQKSVLGVYNELSARYTQLLSEENEKKGGEIKTLLEHVKKHIAANSFELAEKDYKQAKALYNELPEGFLVQKTDLQEELLHLYENMLEKSERFHSEQFSTKLEEMNNLVKEADKYMKGKQHSLAHQVYVELIQAHNSLPVGFAPQKADIRNKTLNLYKELTLRMDYPFLTNMSEDTMHQYNQILKTLITIHRSIDHQKFAAIEISYNHIKQLFNALPVGFVQKQMKLREDILKAYQELQFYNKIVQMDSLLKENRLDDLRALIDEIRKIKEVLAPQCLEDKELFDYAEQKCTYYENALIKPAKKPFFKKIIPTKLAREPEKKSELKPFPLPKPVIKQLDFEKNLAEFDKRISKEFESDKDEVKKKIYNLKIKAAPKVVLPKS